MIFNLWQRFGLSKLLNTFSGSLTRDDKNNPKRSQINSLLVELAKTIIN